MQKKITVKSRTYNDNNNNKMKLTEKKKLTETMTSQFLCKINVF